MSGSDSIDTDTTSHDVARVLASAMRAVLHQEDFEDAARTIFDLCKELIGATAGYVALLSDDGAENELLFLDAGGKECTVDPALPMPVRGLREQAYLSCRPVYENDFSGSAWMEFMPDGHARLANVLFAPLVIDERAVGLIGLANKPTGFTDDDVEHAATLGEIAAIAFENARNLERLREGKARLHSQLAEANQVMAAVLEHTPIMAVLLDKHFNFIWVNRSYADVCGHDTDFFPGKNHFDLYPNQENEAIFHRVLETGEPFFVEARAFEFPGRPELGVTYWDWSLIPVPDQTGDVASLVFTLTNTTEQNRARLAGELIERLQSGPGHSSGEMLTAAVDGLCELLESPIGFFVFVEPDEKTLLAQTWSTATLERFCTANGSDLHYDIDEAGVWADCLRERRAVIHNDYEALENKRGLPKGHAEVIREMVVPILHEQRIVGIFGVGNRTRDYTETDVALASHVAGIFWEIAQRIQAGERLARSEEYYRRSLELFPEAVFMFRDWHFLYANSACLNLLGAQSEDDLLGTPVIERVDPAYHEQARTRVGKLIKEGGVAPLRAAIFLRMDGSPAEVEVTATAFDAPEGTTVLVVVRDLSESIRAEQALREGERFTRNVLDSLPARIGVLDETGVILAVNETWTQFAQENAACPEAFDVGASYLDTCDTGGCMCGAAASDIAAGIRLVLAGETTQHQTEYSCEVAAGPRWFLAVTSRFVGPGPIRAVVTHRNITELRSSREALLERNALLAQAQSIARFGWYDLDVPSGIWENSEVLDEIFGLDDTFTRDVAGWLSVVHPEDRAMMADYFEREVLGAGRAFDKEYRVRRISDGSERWVHSAGRLDTDGTGAVVRMIGTIQDITERRLAEQRIIESGERYRALVEHSPLAILVNRADRVELANAACAELFLAESPDQLLGMSVFDLFHPDDRDQVARRIERLRSRDKPVPLVSERIVRLDGEYRSADVSAAPFKQGDETLLHVVLRDTTAERTAEAELQRRQDKLSELASELIRTSERERHRLAIELHDSVGQALAAAKISARTLADETSDAAKTEESGRLLELLDYSIRHVRTLTAQLSPPALYELGLVPALERLLEDLRSLYGIDCTLHIEHAPERVVQDTGAVLFRAARQLLSNVHRHSGVAVARLTLEERYNSAILRVEDEGHGFDTSALDAGACTDCFGLFSLKEEVRNAGGTVIVRSTPDSGTSVEVSVPLEPKK